MNAERTIVRTTCPRDCYDSCGISVIKEAGQVRHIVGDLGHFVSRGSLCAKCALGYNGSWRDPAQRLQYPLKRAGSKGTGSFQRVSWNEALGEIAERLKAILVHNPADSVIHTHYTGTCSVIAGNFPLRFFGKLGATEVDPDTVCNKAGHEALKYVLGDSLTGFDPRTARDSSCIVVWGANPSASAPHIDEYWLGEASATVIAIDPIAHETAKRASIFLQLRPGSDAALAFAMLHVIRREGLIREDFLAQHAIGWGEILPEVERMTPVRGEALTGVPAAAILKAAMAYARGPSLMWLGQGMQRQPMGGNAIRAAAALCAATGNIGRPGTGLLYLNGPATRGVDMGYVTASHLNPDGLRTMSHMDLAEVLSNKPRSQALFCWNNNILASSPEQGRLRAALAREDLLHVVVELFATDTADYADFVLPAASFLEFDDLLLPYFFNVLSAQAKVMDAPGESLPNQEIFRRLAAAMQFRDEELFEPDAQIIETVLRQTSFDGTFESLKRSGTVELSSKPAITFQTLSFPTPSGKIEIASSRAEAEGHGRIPFPHADDTPRNGRLRVLSPASCWTLNSSYANDRKVAKQLATAAVIVNPHDAAMRRLSDGDRVELINEIGRLPLVLQTSTEVPPGVVLVHKGRWPKLDPARANVNILNPGSKTDMGESSAVHAIEAELVAVEAD